MTSVLGGKIIWGITLLMMMGILTSCVPEEDAVEGSGDNYLRIGDVQIIWGETSTTNVTFSILFSETPTITTTPTTPSSGYSTNVSLSSVSKEGFTLTSLGTPYGNMTVHWQAIGKYK